MKAGIPEASRHSLEALITAEQSIQRAYQWCRKETKSYLDVALAANKFAQDSVISRLPKSIRESEKLFEMFPYLRLRYGGDSHEQ